MYGRRNALGREGSRIARLRTRLQRRSFVVMEGGSACRRYAVRHFSARNAPAPAAGDRYFFAASGGRFPVGKRRNPFSSPPGRLHTELCKEVSMKQKLTNRILSLLLVVVMLFSLIPAAFAQSGHITAT